MVPFTITEHHEGIEKIAYSGAMCIEGEHMLITNGTVDCTGYAVTIQNDANGVITVNPGNANNLANASSNDAFNANSTYSIFRATCAMPQFATAIRGINGNQALILEDNTYTLYVDVNNTFTAQAQNVNSDMRYIQVHPGLHHRFGSTAANRAAITYNLKNLELLMDLVKPAADDFMKYQQAFQSPSGIPYSYKRSIYISKTVEYSGTGLTQIPLDISVRSLTGLLVTLQDPLSGLPGTDSASAYSFPHISSFLRRGLQRAEVVIGGQIYPIYPLLFRKSGDNDANNWNDAHILEAENMFGVIGNAGFTPSFSKAQYDTTRNYGMCMHLGYSNNDAGLLNLVNGNVNASKIPTWYDSSKFVLAFSLAKDDLQQFATGLDTSQSGQLSMNLYWNTLDPFSYLATRIRLNIFAFCDAVFTLQNDANLVRY